MNISEIVYNGRCVSCGMCSAVCPTQAVTMVFEQEEGLFMPMVDENKCVSCSLCVRSCPSNMNSTEATDLIGKHISLQLAHSTDDGIRYQATSGGVISSLVCYLLESGEVDAVLLVCKDDTSANGASAKILTKDGLDEYKSNIRDYASRYVVVPLLEKLRSLRKEYKRVCVIGTPCQINALNLHNDQDIVTIGVTCSGGMRYHATKQYKKMCGYAEASMYYRGNGWPGKNSLLTEDGAIEHNHLGSLFERMFSSQIFKNSGCRNCIDHFAEHADISLCDFWEKEEVENETVGNSCVIVRTERGRRIFDSAQTNGNIEVVRSVSVGSVIRTQKRVLQAQKVSVRTSTRMRMFWYLTDLIRRRKIYECFGKRQYELMVKLYAKTIGNPPLDEGKTKNG